MLASDCDPVQFAPMDVQEKAVHVHYSPHPGPKSPKGNLDIYMQPLIEELVQLWNEGVLTYDVSLRQNFVLKAVILWTVSDFPAYGMLSG